MTKEEKLDKVCKDFSTLDGEKQDYVLGILQALVFAHDEQKAYWPLNEPSEENVIESR
jgi:hypothetical protein